MKNIILFLFISLSSFSYGQKSSYTLTSSIPYNYSYNADSTYKIIFKSLNNELKEKDKTEYSESLAYYHQTMLSSGHIYFNWTEIENYINKLVSSIKQANNITKDFKVFLVRNEDVNASAMDNGFIYVNIGLLADMSDEAALVAILGHEISHAVNTDMKKSYSLVNSKKEVTVKDLLKQSHGSRAFEARADQEGFVAATNLGYDISSAYHSFIKFETDFRWHKSQYAYQDAKWLIALDHLDKDKNIAADSLDFFLYTHPDNYGRIAALNKFTKSKNGGKAYVESEKIFNDIKTKARVEQLYLDFSDASYKDCLKNAFYYHLSDQANPDYIYYISESLRRIILNDPHIKKKGFLTEDSKEKVFEKNKGILNDLSFITLDTTIQKKVKADTIYGNSKKPFNTYLQAYNFFIKKALALKITGSEVTAGLYELTKSNKEKASEYFKARDVDPGFASLALDGNLLSDLKANINDVVYVESPEYYFSEKGKLKFSFLESQKVSEKVSAFFEKEFPVAKGYKTLLFLADSLTIPEYTTIESISENLHLFKNQKEVENGNAENEIYDETLWRSKEAQDPNDAEVLIRKKNFFYFAPEHWLWFKNKSAHSFTHVKPYFYNHPVFGTYFFMEISYFDPINRKYYYFEQEYIERNTNDNMRKVFKAFAKKTQALKGQTN